jgi:hypothetical protein
MCLSYAVGGMVEAVVLVAFEVMMLYIAINDFLRKGII